MTEVRRAHAADAEAVAALVQEVHALHADAHPDVFQPASAAVLTPADVERLAAQPGHLLLVAVRDGRVVGYAHAEVQETPPSAYKRAGAVLHLHAIGVAAAQQGRGVGRALLDAVRDAAAARGLTGLSLDVYAFNTAARAFYEREGFVVLRERLVSPVPARPPSGRARRASDGAERSEEERTRTGNGADRIGSEPSGAERRGESGR